VAVNRLCLFHTQSGGVSTVNTAAIRKYDVTSSVYQVDRHSASLISSAVEFKVVAVYVMKAWRGSGSLAPHILI
jgi:hypothetical protein